MMVIVADSDVRLPGYSCSGATLYATTLVMKPATLNDIMVYIVF